MSKMIERVGKAMADAVALNYDNNQAIFDFYAKAAIKAMREPTEDMVETSAWNAPAGEIIGHVQIKYAWYEMIDKALEE